MKIFVDTHCHLNDPLFNNSLEAALARAEIVGVKAFIVPAYDAPSLERTAELAGKYPRKIFPAFALHPWYIAEGFDYDLIKRFCVESGAVALGETGLDSSPECPPPALQEEAFIKQVEIARELNLPLIIHSRRAHEPVYRILSQYKGGLTGIMHSFSGGAELAMKFVELGFYISFSGAVTRGNAKKYHKTALAVPLERLLLETDAPAIGTQTTEPQQVEPRHIIEVAGAVSALRGISLEELARITTENAGRLFGIDFFNL